MKRLLVILLLLAGCSADCAPPAEASRGRRRGQSGSSGGSVVASSLSVLVDGVDERVTVTDAAALTCATAQTVSVWVRAAAQQSTDCICGKTAGSTTKEWSLQQDAATDEYRVVLGTATTNHCETTTANAAIGAYQHVCYQYDGTQGTNPTRLRIWVNGTEQTLSCSGTIPASIGDTAANMTCGSTSNGAQFFNGYVDEFFMRCALVSCASLYNAGAPGDLTSLTPLVWLRMGEGATFPTIPNTANPGTYDATMTNGEAGDIQAVVP